MESGNLQDNAEVKEYNKGKAAGKQKNSAGSKGKKSPRSRGKRGSGRGSSPQAVYPVTTGSQPLAYLNKYPTLAQDSAQVTFERAIGNSINFKRPSDVSAQFPEIKFSGGSHFPAILYFDITTTLGGANRKSDAFNLANAALYAFIRSKNTGVPPFDPPMVGLYTVAASECIKLYTHLVRALGLSNYITTQSNVAPYYLMNAVGFNYSDIANNSAEYRASLNKMALRLSAIPIPKGMEYITVDKWLFENVFRDANSLRAQLYCFRPHGFLKLIEGNPEHPLTYLDMIPIPHSSVQEDVSYINSPVFDFDDMLNALDDMINAIIGSEDCQRVAAEILKAFDGGSLISVNPIAETYTVNPIYDEKVATIIENMTVMSQTQAYYYVTYDPSINGGAMIERLLWDKDDIENVVENFVPVKGQPSSLLMNFHKDAVDYRDVMLASSLVCFGLQPKKVSIPESEPYGAMEAYKLRPHGFTVCVGAWLLTTASDVVTVTEGAKVEGYSFPFATFPVFTNTSSNESFRDYIRVSSCIESFDWHPTQYMMYYNTTNETLMMYQPYVDLDKFALVGSDVIANVHDVAVLSGYSSQELGIYSLR